MYKGENSWAENFKEIIKHKYSYSIKEIFEFYTSLVNSNGKCIFNLNNNDFLNENKFLFLNKMITKKFFYFFF